MLFKSKMGGPTLLPTQSREQSHFCHASPFGMHPYVPFEILVTILSNLDWRTLVCCQTICRYWRHAIRDTLYLQYKISLGLNGYEDGQHSGLSLPERVRLLEERSRRWRTLGFKRRVTIPTPGECHAYELVGGIFAKAMNADSGDGNGLGGPGLVTPISMNPGSRHFALLKLPGASVKDEVDYAKNSYPDAGADVAETSDGRNSISGAVVVREDVGVLCRDFGIDPTQDLIALVEQPDVAKPSITIHLRTISTNEKHPLASIPVLVQPMRSSLEGAEIQICDDIVAIFVRIHSVPRLVIWEWTSGKLLVSESDARVCKSLDDFSLISPYAFMVTSRFDQGSIKVYTFRSNSNSPLPYRALAKLSDLRCTSLLLPTLQSNNHYAEITTHTAPFTACVPKREPFATSEEVRVHVMSILTSPTSAPHSSSDSEIGGGAGGGIGGGHPGCFVVVILNKCLLKYADLHFDNTSQEVLKDDVDDGKSKGKAAKKRKRQDDFEVPWEDWGPRNTRWFSERNTHAWQRYVHGSRIVRTLHNAWPSTRCRIQVLDFNVHPSHPACIADRENETIDNVEPDVPYCHTLVAGPSLIRDRSVFRGGGVESRLPYRDVRLKNEVGPYSGFMIDEERVVGLSPMAFANGDMKQIDVFTF